MAPNEAHEGRGQMRRGSSMNTDVINHPTLQHVGLITPDLDRMLDFYRKVLGITAHQRVQVPEGRAPFRAVAFATNDEINHRLSFFEIPAATVNPDKDKYARVQHIAFAYGDLDELLGTYLRLKALGMTPQWAADQSFQTAIYYEDPDGNVIELNVDNFTNLWAVTEQLQNLPQKLHVYLDMEKVVAARKAGATPWQIHERAWAGEFLPADKYELSTSRW
jgi:catechol-2,3-dioxygenase